MPLRLRYAVLLTFVCHAVLILAGRYRLSYDAFTHMFFADHYLHDWGSLWDARWYAGFTVVSYPPLVHQVMALIGYVTGVDAAFAIVLLVVVVCLTLAIYAFARVFVSADGAGYAAMGGAVLPSIYLSAHVFGQLPTLAAALAALLALASLARFLRTGHRTSGALTIALCAVVVAAHHATLLFLPWGVLAVALHLLINRQVGGRILLLRLVLVGSLAVLAGMLVIWPFWQWGMVQNMQTPIDHLSRHNFLTDRSALLFFFVAAYGLLAVIIPFAFWGLSRRSLLAPAALFVLLFVLGLGGTTPLPRLLFGSGWAWLTYDRFALWASLVLLVFCGEFVHRALHGLLLLRVRDGLRRGLRIGIAVSVFSTLVLMAFASALFPILYPTQPPHIDMRPIATFLNEADHMQWRYLTFGFGDQYAALSLMTSATTIDGSYHSARTLPELRQSGIGQLDTALWSDKGVDALDPILQQSGAHAVRWGFVDRIEYIPVLLRNGWLPRETLADGIEEWENPAAVKPIVPGPHPSDDPLQAFSWAVLPLTGLVVASILGAGFFRPIGVKRLLLNLHTLAVGLLPASLSFWIYRDLVAIHYDRIYFTYSDVLLYLNDILILVAVMAWGLARLVDRQPLEPLATGRSTVPVVNWLTRLLLAFCLLATISILWSVDSRISLYMSLHLWLLFGFYCSLKDHPINIRTIVLGASAALMLQVGIGIAEFSLQSTAFLLPLNVKWPGAVEPAMRGASVVQLADGARWLRIYGSLPHPNILAGLVSVLLAGPIAWLLVLSSPAGKSKTTPDAVAGRVWLYRGIDVARRVFAFRHWHWVPAFFLVSGMVLLFLTFSRSAWLGCVAAAGVLALHHRQFERRRLIMLLMVAVLGVMIGFLPLNRLVFARFTGFSIPTEQQSIDDRVWMTEQALSMIRAHPLLGVGIGGFAVEMSNHDPGAYPIEPAHNVLLLAVSELGLPGALLMVAFAVVLIIGIGQSNNPAAIITLAVIVALTVTAVFDHYLWTLAPGRALLWWVLGLWAGALTPYHTPLELVQ